MAPSRPNILFILADDLGYADVSCYGRRDFTTPNIDRIAAEGVRFTQAYANSAVCTASRVALITGRYQYRLAVGLEEPLSTRVPRKIGLPADHPTLPSLLKKAGYQSALIGKWHLGRLPDFGPLQSGYDISTVSAAARSITSRTNPVRRRAIRMIYGRTTAKSAKPAT